MTNRKRNAAYALAWATVGGLIGAVGMLFGLAVVAGGIETARRQSREVDPPMPPSAYRGGVQAKGVDR